MGMGSSGKRSGGGALKPIIASRLPALEGSAKQVAWATDIRQNVIDGMNRQIEIAFADNFRSEEARAAQTVLKDGYLKKILGSDIKIPTGTGLSRAARAAKKAELGDKYGSWVRNTEDTRKKKACADLLTQARSTIATKKSASWWIDHR